MRRRVRCESRAVHGVWRGPGSGRAARASARRAVSESEKIVVAWRSDDPFGRQRSHQRVAGDMSIRHHVQPTNKLLVCQAGHAPAKICRSGFSRPTLRKRRNYCPTLREREPFALDETEDSSQDVEQGSATDRAREHEWSSAAATVEIWNGEDGALAELHEACLRENRIGVRREGAEPNSLRLLIMPADEPAARENYSRSGRSDPAPVGGACLSWASKGPACAQPGAAPLGFKGAGVTISATNDVFRD